MERVKSFFKGTLRALLWPGRAIRDWFGKHPVVTGVLYGIVLAVILSGSHYMVSERAQIIGYDEGKIDGRCEMMCAYLGMGYETYSEDPSACWCETSDGQYYPLPYVTQK